MPPRLNHNSSLDEAPDFEDPIYADRINDFITAGCTIQKVRDRLRAQWLAQQAQLKDWWIAQVTADAAATTEVTTECLAQLQAQADTDEAEHQKKRSKLTIIDLAIQLSEDDCPRPT